MQASLGLLFVQPERDERYSYGALYHSSMDSSRFMEASKFSVAFKGLVELMEASMLPLPVLGHQPNPL